MSTDRQPSEAPLPSDEESRFGYFLLHTRHEGTQSGRLRWVTLEDLTSGAKWTFTSGSDLVRFLDPTLRGEQRWARPAPPDPAGPSSSPDGVV